MGQVLHRSARTTAAVRRAIQHSQARLTTLAERYDINPKTVAKWKRRDFAHDASMGPKQAHSTVLTPEQEAACVAFQKHTLLPLDDCLYALQASIPQLTRSSLHRCFQRHSISRLPDVTGDTPARKKFKTYPIVISTSTMSRCERKWASSTCSLRSTAHRSVRTQNWLSAPANWKQRNSYGGVAKTGEVVYDARMEQLPCT